MKLTVRMFLVLGTIGIISGFSLSFVYRVSAPLIAENELRELKESVFIVLPEAKDYKKRRYGETVIYEGYDSDGSLIGYAFSAEGNGFQGKIKLMIGIDRDLERLKGIKVLSHVETPGLGGKIADEGFQRQFAGVAVAPKITYVQNKKPEKENEIQAITGATISSKSVVGIINRKVKEVEKALKGGA